MVCETLEISFRFMKEHFKEDFEKIDWTSISSFKFLSEDFMREFKDKLNWNVMITSQKLSEDFIREHISYIKNWKALTNVYYNTLSVQFIVDYYKFLDKHIIANVNKFEYGKNNYGRMKDKILSTRKDISLDDINISCLKKKDYKIVYSNEI